MTAGGRRVCLATLAASLLSAAHALVGVAEADGEGAAELLFAPRAPRARAS